MELFAPENQSYAPSMLLDLVKLYMLFYGLNTLEAKKAIREDVVNIKAYGGELSMVAQAR